MRINLMGGRRDLRSGFRSRPGCWGCCAKLYVYRIQIYLKVVESGGVLSALSQAHTLFWVLWDILVCGIVISPDIIMPSMPV